MGKMNTAELQTTKGREAVRNLMFEDGFGLDEALAFSREYAEVLCFGGATPTAIATIERHVRSICRVNA